MSALLPQLEPVLASFYRSARAPDGQLQALKGDASTRRYYRFSVRDPLALASGQPSSLIVMELPRDERSGAPATEQAQMFMNVQGFLSAQRLPVPRIHAADLNAGLLLLEDLGDLTFEARLHANPTSAWPSLYGQAIDLLADLHAACAPEQHGASECIAYTRSFDAKLLRYELDHFREWGAEALHGPLTPSARCELDACFDELLQALLALPQGFAHRDYQSRNLMWAPGDRLTVIDFQDALLGPCTYDLVALLCDSYVDIDAQLQQAMLDRYAQRRAFTPAQHAEQQRAFQLIAAQRKLKDAGRFVFLDRVRGNPGFLQYYPHSLRYVERAVSALAELAPLRAWLARHIPGFPEHVATPISQGRI